MLINIDTGKLITRIPHKKKVLKRGENRLAMKIIKLWLMS